MTFLAIGIVVLLALAVLARLVSSADPILLTKVLRWSLIILGVFFALFFSFPLIAIQIGRNNGSPYLIRVAPHR